MSAAPVVASLSGLSVGLTILLGVLAVIGGIVGVYLFTISKVRQGTAELQTQSGEAQQQLIGVMQIEQDQMRAEITQLTETKNHQDTQIRMLHEAVTQAAKVDALRTDIEVFNGNVEKMFVEIDAKQDQLMELVGGITR